MKKTMKYLLAMLPVVAGLMFSSCSNEEAVAEQPAKQDIEELGKVQYSLTVSKADATTRATIGADLKTIQFDDDDTELYVFYQYNASETTDYRFLFGTLSRTSLSENKLSATFSGELTDARYTNTATDDYTLVAPPVPFNINNINSYWSKTAHVSLKNTGFTTAGDLFKEYGYDEKYWGRKDISPTMYNYNNALYGSLEDAMAHCHLHGYGDFDTGNFTLNPYTAFLVFTFTLQDGSEAGDEITVEATDLTDDATEFPDRSGTVIAYKDGDEEDSPIKATVVIPVRGGNDHDGMAGAHAGALWGTNPMLTITTQHEEFVIAFGNKIAAHGTAANYAARVYRFKKTLVGKPTINYEAVDLGLTSGTKWATANIGSTTPEGEGYYFAWGTKDGYLASDNHAFSKTSYGGNKPSEWEITNDPARYYMGTGWTVPTAAQCDELIKNTTQTDVTVGGVQGTRFTSKTDNTKSIFIPRTQGFRNASRWSGFFGIWTSTAAATGDNVYYMPIEDDASFYAYDVPIVTVDWSNPYYYGLPVRGVKQ